jgi:hypothetical protein
MQTSRDVLIPTERLTKQMNIVGLHAQVMAISDTAKPRVRYQPLSVLYAGATRRILLQAQSKPC